MLARARAETTDLALGVDANAAGMVEAATRAARKPSKGGAPNARFIVAAAEALPPELAAIADLVTVQFPWGSLLRGIVRGEAGIVCPLAGLLKPVADAELRLLISVEARDRALGLAALDASGVDRIVHAFGEAGTASDRRSSRDDRRPGRRPVDLGQAPAARGRAEREAWLLRFASASAVSSMLGSRPGHWTMGRATTEERGRCRESPTPTSSGCGTSSSSRVPEERRRLSRFWILLVLAAIIAAAGVVADSTATVIGAMIVAPLMTPDPGHDAGHRPGRPAQPAPLDHLRRGRRARSSSPSASCSASPIAVPVVAETNPQVAARVAPRLIDLVAALATGAVGAFALTRSDVSDTLPGVAIAISLVPPLAVVGLTLESGAPDQAAGALLLFVTNVSAILASGVVVMALYHVYEHLPTPGAMTRYVNRQGRRSGRVAVMVVLVMVPLAATSTRIGQATLDEIGGRVDGRRLGGARRLDDRRRHRPSATRSSSEPRAHCPSPTRPTLRAALDARGPAAT